MHPIRPPPVDDRTCRSTSRGQNCTHYYIFGDLSDNPVHLNMYVIFSPSVGLCSNKDERRIKRRKLQVVVGSLNSRPRCLPVRLNSLPSGCIYKGATQTPKSTLIWLLTIVVSRNEILCEKLSSGFRNKSRFSVLQDFRVSSKLKSQGSKKSWLVRSCLGSAR